MPAQNLLVGDREGRLAWTIAGRIPNRVGYDGTAPADWSQPGIGWDGWLAPEHYPQVVDPASHRIWTANARVVDGDAYARIGAGEYALGARARQIRDDLFARDRFAPTDLLAIQLDDRTLFQQRWWQLLRDTLAKAPGDAALTELASVTATWDERASTDAVAYRMARAFRIHVHTIVADSLAAPMRQHDVAFVMPGLSQSEGIVWAMLQQKPMNLLSPHYADWDALLLDCAHRTANDFAGQPGGLAQRTWGERNRSRIRHPLSGAVPFLSRWLDMPSRELAGDSAMPRVQGPSFGASERFAVSPGHEADGYLHMPGGQSGHPFSPYYGAGHSAWEEGKATPFLPGAAEHTLTFSPAR
jgi:penicillin G amidase